MIALFALEHEMEIKARTVLRQPRDTLEDLDDRRDLARAKRQNAGKPGTDWEAVKKELGFES